jgi:hypothetical protein
LKLSRLGPGLRRDAGIHECGAFRTVMSGLAHVAHRPFGMRYQLISCRDHDILPAVAGQGMKIGELASFGHNLADSLASGICFMVGIYSVDIHGEAAASPEGHIFVDFLTASTSGAPMSPGLARAIRSYSEMLPELARSHGLDASEIKVLCARFGTDPVAGPHFVVTVETSDGRKSVDQYVGSPGRRYGKSRRGTA